MLREYQRQLNVCLWPGGNTVHQEAQPPTPHPAPPPLHILSYSSAHRITIPSINICFENVRYIKLKWKQQTENADYGGVGGGLKLRTSPWDNLERKWWTPGTDIQAESIFFSSLQTPKELRAFKRFNSRWDGDVGKLIKQEWEINRAHVFSCHYGSEAGMKAGRTTAEIVSRDWGRGGDIRA